ncbi:serine hydrolase [Lactobacillus sp. ESL0785]|uniref:serine hydrolase n=1 Tax=Lactobacillus sp. ESL0785 TaxID=2983232 RepID=UPI0023F9DA26|nr:serine hydrolase [Lactobacillus sp. ESL0785]WEV71150.1 serine hydrolase [Lactobacillus sp. ESL0785]
MKNKILVGSLLVAFFSFMLYSTSLKRIENANLHVVEPRQSKTIKGKKAVSKPSEPHVDEVEYANHVKVARGSEKSWAKQIEQTLGQEKSYQVCVQDLNSHKFVRIANSTKQHGVTATSRLFLLVSVYYQEQHGKLSARTAIKVHKKDRVKGEKLLRVGYSYGIAYLKQAMMHGNKTAANVLLRKVGPSRVNRLLSKMGATNTKIGNKFTANPVSMTTAADLVQVMTNLGQNKTLNRQYVGMVLTALNLTHAKSPLVRAINGQSYSVFDSKSVVALVQSRGHTYCVGFWGSSNQNMAKLGRTINQFF